MNKPLAQWYHAPVRKALLLLFAALFASVILSVVIWRPLLTDNRPTTPPLTADERRYGPGFDRTAGATMAERLPAPLRFDAAFDDVINSFRNRRSIFVNWRAVEEASIARRAAVHVEVGGMRFDDALNKILASADEGMGRLGFTLDEGIVTISTIEDLSRNTMTRVYDVRNLMPPAPAPVTSPTGGSGQSLNFAGPPTPTAILTLEAQLRSSIDPPSWRNAGDSGVGTIRILGSNLIINQTTTNHHDIVRLLERVRWHRDLRAFGRRATATAGAAFALALIVCLILAWHRRGVRSREGLCPGCGYDLRASSDRCPECGQQISPLSLPLPSGGDVPAA